MCPTRGSSFDCTTNDPVNQVLLAGACGSIPSSLCNSKGLKTVATITFTVVGTGSTRIGGTIVKIQDSGTTVSNAAIYAGDDLLVVPVPSAGHRSMFDSNYFDAKKYFYIGNKTALALNTCTSSGSSSGLVGWRLRMLMRAAVWLPATCALPATPTGMACSM